MVQKRCKKRPMVVILWVQDETCVLLLLFKFYQNNRENYNASRTWSCQCNARIGKLWIASTAQYSNSNRWMTREYRIQKHRKSVQRSLTQTKTPKKREQQLTNKSVRWVAKTVILEQSHRTPRRWRTQPENVVEFYMNLICYVKCCERYPKQRERIFQAFILYALYVCVQMTKWTAAAAAAAAAAGSRT